VDREKLDGLLEGLRSEDAFERREAEERLRAVARRDFGFRWDSPAEERQAALERLRAWVLREASARREARKTAAGAAALELAKLQGLSPEEAQAKLDALLSKGPALAEAALGLPTCLECSERPATVEVVDLRDGRSCASVRLCEPCLARRRGA
jgi:hypothetical protein